MGRGLGKKLTGNNLTSYRRIKDVDGYGHYISKDSKKIYKHLVWQEGQCHAFAAALSNLTGWRIAGVVQKGDLKPEDAHHFFCIDEENNLYIDNEGVKKMDSSLSKDILHICYPWNLKDPSETHDIIWCKKEDLDTLGKSKDWQKPTKEIAHIAAKQFLEDTKINVLVLV